ncbi:hypothetical protein Sya03_36900 [Spirilliplanes yamanashiensis]|uniref:Uncharacterized protein n=2 Tax=Spirilliplanes yamanashiensis TaxID=42233 RepID=A0A8J3Y9F4_9ACTN|nr:hypothetical protein Sya03_36900 [Spirilliplanes yamanashiensis]
MSILRRSLLLGAAACVAAAGSVAATQAHAAAEPNAGRLTLTDKGVLVFTAGAGVANDSSTQGTLDPILLLTDEAAKIEVDPSAATMCTSITDRKVRCTGQPEHNINVVVKLGDLADRHVALASYPHLPELEGAGYIAVTVYGGTGGDQLDGNSSSAPVVFYGQDGRDRMAGGAQNDLLDAGSTVWWPRRRQEVIGNGGEDTCRGAFVDALSCEL